jgi:prepilin-type N-terminal cleavage/methylation domain-containing protein
MQKNSFTLVELLIVLVIVAILAMLAVAISQKMIERAEVRQAVTDLGALRKAELAYYQETGGYYTSSNWLPAPVPPDGGLSYSMWTGSFPPDFPITKSNKLFTYKAMKEFGWGRTRLFPCRGL